MLTVNFHPFPVLSTKRLELRQLLQSDDEEIYFLRRDEGVNKYIDRPRANSIDDAKKFIQRITDAINNNESIFWAITMRDQPKLIGTICLWNISPEKEKAEIGYEMLPAHQGKGLMHEAVEEVLDYAFEFLKFKTVEAYTHQENQKSSALLAKNHFKRDVEFDKHKGDNEELKHMVVYYCTRPR